MTDNNGANASDRWKRGSQPDAASYTKPACADSPPIAAPSAGAAPSAPANGSYASGAAGAGRPLPGAGSGLAAGAPGASPGGAGSAPASSNSLGSQPEYADIACAACGGKALALEAAKLLGGRIKSRALHIMHTHEQTTCVKAHQQSCKRQAEGAAPRARRPPRLWARSARARSTGAACWPGPPRSRSATNTAGRKALFIAGLHVLLEHAKGRRQRGMLQPPQAMQPLR